MDIGYQLDDRGATLHITSLALSRSSKYIQYVYKAIAGL